MRFISRLLIIIIPAIILSIFLLIDISPSGTRITTLQVDRKTPFINRPLPDSRVEVGDSSFIITGNPVYFTVKPPAGHWDSIEVELKFQPNNIPLIEIGPQMSLFSQAFDLQPLWSKELNNLTWPKKTFGNINIWDRLNRIDNFNEALELERSPDTLIYNHEITTPFILSDYQANPDRQIISFDARGSHRLQAYIDDEDLDIKFLFTDMNRIIGRDDIMIRIFNENSEQVFYRKIEDDGNERNDQQVSRHDVHILVEDLPRGVYDIDIQTTNDIFFREIDTTLSKLVFRNKLHLADPIGWRLNSPKTDFITDGTEFSLQTLHATGTQDIQIGQETFSIEEPLKRYQYLLDEVAWRPLSIPQANLEIVNNGVITFDQSFAFNPNPKILSSWTSIEQSDINQVISTYQPPSQTGDWYHKTISFDATSIPRIENDAWRFAISTPTIDQSEQGLHIEAIQITFRRQPLYNLHDWLSALRSIIPF